MPVAFLTPGTLLQVQQHSFSNPEEPSLHVLSLLCHPHTHARRRAHLLPPRCAPLLRLTRALVVSAASSLSSGPEQPPRVERECSPVVCQGRCWSGVSAFTIFRTLLFSLSVVRSVMRRSQLRCCQRCYVNSSHGRRSSTGAPGRGTEQTAWLL